MEYQNPKIADLDHCSAALILELDPAAPDFSDIPPAPLDRSAAEQVASHIADDIRGLFGGIDKLGMVAAGALYDQTELLRPGFPLLDALRDIFRGTLSRGGFVPQLIALGTTSGRFPIAAITPQRRPGSGPLLVLPFVFVGRKLNIATLSSNMENALLQTGTVSEATITAVQHAFGLRAVNMSYATAHDLCALLKVQLENSGFEPLWELLEHALFRRSGGKRVRLASGNCFLLTGNQVYAPYYTFDDWSQFGLGRDLDPEQLASAYGIWVRAHRQYALALSAYGLSVRPVLATPTLEQDDVEQALSAAGGMTTLEGDYFVETAERADSDTPERRLVITHQTLPDLGTLAYSVLALDQTERPLALEHYYPLSPHGVEAIVDHLIRRSDDFGIERRVLHPGALVFSPQGRCLESCDEPESSVDGYPSRFAQRKRPN